PFEELRKASCGRGLINAELEPMNKDGITRKMFYSFKLSGKKYSSFSSVIASHFLGKKVEAPHYVFDKDICYFYMNYFEHSRIETIPFRNFFNKKEVEKMKALNYLKDKIVIIGPAFGEKDYYYTPFGRTRGMRMHADTINAICYGEFIWGADRITNIILTIILMIIAYFLFSYFKGGYIYSIILAIIYSIASLYIFRWFGYIIDILPAVTCIFSSSTLCLFINLYYRLWEANQSLKKRVIELTILYDISNKLSEMEMSDQDKRLKVLIDKSTPALDAERGSVMILDHFTEELEVKAVFDKRFKQFRKGIKLKLGEGIAGRVAMTGKPIRINNVKEDERFVIFTDRDEEIRNLTTVPMITQNKTIGVLNFVNKHKSQKFSEADLKLAMTIAQAAATIIENARLYREATIDGMTGLYVHRYFKRRLAEELQRARRYNISLSLIMTDIDHFKSFNDTYGHQIGDFVLQGVAQIIKDAVRDIDVPARYGGEEFIVILPETTQEGAHILAERIRQRIADTDFKTDSGILRVAISVGVSTYPETDVEEADEFIKTADEAMYEAKQTGRNKTIVYNKK
ncbi:diguanylate cyclase, partial [bacterium]|nr:diguanylate cyclase [bacterium]